MTSVTLLGQYDTWSVSRPNLPPFRACEHASWAVLSGSPQTLITGNSHACPKCEPTRARPNCLHNPPSIAQRPAPRDALIVNEAQPAWVSVRHAGSYCTVCRVAVAQGAAPAAARSTPSARRGPTASPSPPRASAARDQKVRSRSIARVLACMGTYCPG